MVAYEDHAQELLYAGDGGMPNVGEEILANHGQRTTIWEPSPNFPLETSQPLIVHGISLGNFDSNGMHLAHDILQVMLRSHWLGSRMKDLFSRQPGCALQRAQGVHQILKPSDSVPPAFYRESY